MHLKITSFLVLLLFPILLSAQVNPNLGSIAHTIYLSPDGDDANTGTFDDPLKTFGEALFKLPYGNNGETAYSEVVFLAGQYIIDEEIRQPCWQYTNDSGLKSVSIRGAHQDSVVLDGSNAQSVSGNFIELLGSGISIKDLTIKLVSPTDTSDFWAAIDFYSAINDCAIIPTTDVLIENITIDGSWDHGINLDQMENVLVRNCEVRNTNLTNINGRNDNGGSFTWGSGIKTRLSNTIEIHHCKVSNCWGEGIATSRTTNAFVHHNEVSNNYSVNIYLDNVINGIYTNNLCYATKGDDTFWRGSAPSSGFGIAAEHYSSDNLNRTENIKIYNNIILNTQGVYFDDNRHSGEPKIVDLKNIWFCHNDIIGWDGDISTNLRAIRIDFADYNANNLDLDSIYLLNNIIAVSQDFIDPSGNGQVISGSSELLPPTLFFSHNYWSVDPQKFTFFNYAFNENTDTINIQIPVSINETQLSQLIPSDDNSLRFEGQNIPFVLSDFYDNNRFSKFNVGAIRAPLPTAITKAEKEKTLSIYPNPSNGRFFISQKNTLIGAVKVFDSSGKIVWSQRIESTNSQLDFSNLGKGLFWLKTEYNLLPVILK